MNYKKFKNQKGVPMNAENWMDDPRVKNITPEKKLLLEKLIKEGTSKTEKEMMPFFMSAMTTVKKSNINLTTDEASLLIEILMEKMSPTERKKTEQVLAMARKFHKQHS